MTWVLGLALGLLVVLAITVATGYFVAQEFAYMAVDRSRLAARAEAGDAGAKRALTVTRRTSFMLSGAQLGITVTGLLVGFVAEPLVGTAVGQALGGANVPSAVGIAIGTVFALVLATVIQMVFGELFPKNLAIARPEQLAIGLSRSTVLYLAVFGWLIRFFDASSNGLLRLVRIEPVHDVEHSATTRDLEHIVADSRDSGDLPHDLSILLDRILDFPQQELAHAMVPRNRVDVVEEGETLGHLRRLMAAGHSRYPVVDEAHEVVGVVHLTDLLTLAPPDQVLVSTVMRPALALPTTMALPVALRELNASESQMACVVDEYGGFAGIVTLEDLAEELVGEIADEHDMADEEAPTQETGHGSWIISGDVHIDEVERVVDRELPHGDYETIAGLVISTLGSLPPPGTVVDIELPMDPASLSLPDPALGEVLQVEVLSVARHVPSRVQVTLVLCADPDESNRGRG